MTVKSLYRITNTGTVIDVVFYSKVNGKTVHADSHWSEESGAVIRRNFKEPIAGKSHRYYWDYRTAWEVIRMRLEEMMGERGRGQEAIRLLGRHMTQKPI